jgi:hypothetical protein
VPFLMDIPILGNLLLQRADSKQREELIVLMRPTVLPTPKLAADNTFKEEQTLPGVARAEFDDADENRKLIDAERKLELQKYKATHHKSTGFYTPQPDAATTNELLDIPVPQGTNNPPPPPGEDIEEVTPVPQAVHPGVMPPAAPLAAPTAPPAAPAAPTTPPAAPGAENANAPLDQAAMQQKAADALAQKMVELNSSGSGH